MALQLKWDARPPAGRTDNFSKSDNNTLRQILAEGKNLNFCIGSKIKMERTENLEKWPSMSHLRCLYYQPMLMESDKKINKHFIKRNPK